jgi:hypothetical protein
MKCHWKLLLATFVIVALPSVSPAQTTPPPPDQPPTTAPPQNPPATPPQTTPPQQTPPPATPPQQTPPPTTPPETTPPQTPPPATPPTTPPQTTPPQTTPPTTAPEQPAKTEQPAMSAQDHLEQAKTALNSIDVSAVPASARAKLTELRRHMTALERSVAANDNPSATATARRNPRATATRGTASWATEVAAIDRLLNDLIGATAPATGDTTSATGTGTVGTTGSARPGRARTPATITIDDATRAKLIDVRKHITEFAAAMSGTATTAPEAQTPADQPATSATAKPAAAKVDQEAAKAHLTAARDVLSQLTQLPEAAQLTGDARTQVTNLITNFNQLITTQSKWRDTYAKVQENLTALVGAETADEANVPPPATATAGAVGTSGMATLEPKVRAKLIEFRKHLVEFERAAGGAK